MESTLIQDSDQALCCVVDTVGPKTCYETSVFSRVGFSVWAARWNHPGADKNPDVWANYKGISTGAP